MYRPDDIKTGLFGLWGWRQNWDTEAFQIANSLVASSSGQYFQEAHPLLTLANVRAVAPEFDTDEQFNTWLTQKTQASILKAIRTFWDEKMVQKTAKNILESKALFNGAGRITDLIENSGDLVGFELIPIRANGVTLKINKIGLQFTGQGTMDLYLMHSSRRDFIKNIELSRIRDGSMEWFTPTEELYLPYLSDENDAGGSWYLVYDQSKLPAGLQAINKSQDWSAKPCGAQAYSETQAVNRRSWSRYLEVHPFKVPADVVAEQVGDYNDDFNSDFATTGPYLWDVSKNQYTYETNYGINLQVTVECDATDIIIEQRKAFQSIIGLQVAADFLREFAYNPEFKIQRTSVNLSKEQILYELDGDSRGEKESGIKYDLRKAMEAVKLDVTGLSRVCFPCNNGGIRYKAI